MELPLKQIPNEVGGRDTAQELTHQLVLTCCRVTSKFGSLPFISYGGSAVLFTLAEMGIALSVNRYHMRRSLQRKRAELEKEEEQ